MTAVIARIVLRYVSGALVAYGFIPHEVGAEVAMDPDLALILGSGIGAVTEVFYALAVKRGWAK